MLRSRLWQRLGLKQNLWCRCGVCRWWCRCCLWLRRSLWLGHSNRLWLKLRHCLGCGWGAKVKTLGASPPTGMSLKRLRRGQLLLELVPLCLGCLLAKKNSKRVIICPISLRLWLQRWQKLWLEWRDEGKPLGTLLECLFLNGGLRLVSRPSPNRWAEQGGDHCRCYIENLHRSCDSTTSSATPGEDKSHGLKRNTSISSPATFSLVHGLESPFTPS